MCIPIWSRLDVLPSASRLDGWRIVHDVNRVTGYKSNQAITYGTVISELPEGIRKHKEETANASYFSNISSK